MFAVCKNGGLLVSSMQRYGVRCVSSVVPDMKLPEYPLVNEPVLTYKKGSKERKELEAALKKTASAVEDVPIIIGSEEFRTNNVRHQVMPHNHSHKIAQFYWAENKLVEKAIKTATETQVKWDRTPISERVKIWQKAADLMAGPYRAELNAATMLGQAKTVIQAEIDSAAELIDFIRMNTVYLKEASKYQPISENSKVTKNSLRFRGIDGFIAAVSPFNFTAIGGNLAYTPALMGNGVLWKPSDTALLSNYVIFKIMREAGVPPGVVNFIPTDGPVFGDTITASPHLAGINFTGSVPTFNRLWRQVGENINIYNNFPRLIGECGGKNYHFVHPSADVQSVVNGTIRSSFEFCGQKCSACSRMYVPESLWPQVKEGLIKTRDTLKIGDVTDFSTFTSAVIDDKAFSRIKSYIDHAKSSKNLQILAGGKCDDSKGYFIEPTIVQSTDPKDKIMTEEIFGPVLSIYVYKDKDLDQTMKLVGNSTRFALTGAVFSKDEGFLKRALEEFKLTAGNFYLNDKSTGSVVGQQPFGGGRMSGSRKVIRVEDSFTNYDRYGRRADQFVKVSAVLANSQLFSELLFLHSKSMAEAELCYSLEDESDLSLAIDYNKCFNLNELNGVLSHGTGKAVGLADIGYPTLKKLDFIGRLAILDTMNRVWLTGAIPDEWKEELVIPIPKERKNMTLAEDYRPITLFSCMGKTFERMVSHCLSTILEKYEWIQSQHHAFRCGYVSETLFSELDRLMEEASSEDVNVVSCDLYKNFDMT